MQSWIFGFGIRVTNGGGKGITLTEDEGRNLYEALKEIYEPE